MRARERVRVRTIEGTEEDSTPETCEDPDEVCSADLVERGKVGGAGGLVEEVVVVEDVGAEGGGGGAEERAGLAGTGSHGERRRS